MARSGTDLKMAKLDFYLKSCYSVDYDFGAGNGSKLPEGGCKSDVDSGTNRADRQPDGIHRPPTFASFLLEEKWTTSSKLLKEELTSVHVWIKFHGVPVLAFTTDRLSAIATHLGTPVMDGRAPKNTLVIFIPNPIGNGVTMHTIKVEYEWKPSRYGTCLVFGHDEMQYPKRVITDLRKHRGTSNDGFQSFQNKDFHGPLVIKHGTGDNGKPMSDLVDDTRKKVEAPPRKQSLPRET
ncbi:zinc knuckle CX2CX4HX4C containing protein [Tanacetum coccineum]